MRSFKELCPVVRFGAPIPLRPAAPKKLKPDPAGPVRKERAAGSFFMPKSYSDLWPAVTSFESLLGAWHAVRRGKRFSPVIIDFWRHLEENLLGLQQALLDHGWGPKPLRRFTVQFPKPRAIQAPACEDRVVHHALMGVVAPLFERRFRPESYACRQGLGVHAASCATTEMLRAARRRWEHPWVLQGDIAAFFASIDHSILMGRVRRVVRDPDVLWLFETIIRNTAGYNGVGLPLGSLTSQWLANLYLDPLDHLLKDDIGVPYYARYMDDWVLIGPNKEWCRVLLEQISTFAALQRLRLNPKTRIYPASHGVDFVGYRHWADHTLPRKRTVKRGRAQLKALRRLYTQGRIDLDYIRPRVASFVGYMRHCDGWRSLEALLEDFVLTKGD